MWGYHSYISLQEDQNAGLTGSTIVYAAGKMNATVASYREFVLVYMQFDESDSFMSLINKQAPGVSNASAPALDANAFPMPTLGQGYGNYSIWHPQLVNVASSLELNSTQAPTFVA